MRGLKKADRFEACPWNRKHIRNPLLTVLTESFQKSIADWEKLFYLPNLVELSKKRYQEKFGNFNTGIPYEIFHRNVLIALERAKTIEK